MSLSKSVPANVNVTAVCSVAATSVWAVATGASLTALSGKQQDQKLKTILKIILGQKHY